MKPKVIIIITRSEIGGAQKYVLSMVGALKHQYCFVVIVGSEGYLSSALEEHNINVHILPQIDSMNIIGAVYTLYKLINKIKPELINTHSMLASFYARVANLKLKKPIIHSVHGWFFTDNATPIRKFIGPLIESFLARHTTFWMTETNFDLNLGIEVGAISSREKACAIPNGIPTPISQKKIIFNDKFKQLVFVGRLSYQKNPELAIEVMSLLPNDYKLTLYCDNADNQAIVELINELNLTEKITLIDSENNTASIIHSYEVLLVTSRYEGMPLSMIEAMSAGLPIVTSNVCGLNELVTNGENGYLVKNDSALQFAKRIEDIFSDKKRLESMQHNSRERYMTHHTIEKMVRSISEVFDNQIIKNTHDQ